MAKKVTGIRKKKRKLGRIIGTLSLVTTVIVIITLSVLYQYKPEPIPKKTADEYFRFSEAQALGHGIDPPTNSSIMIQEVHFNITVVGGKATDVTIAPVQGYVDRADYPYFEEMKQNQTEEIIIEYVYKVVSRRNDQGYPVYFDIYCKEAEGRVTLNITKFYPSD
ncbi:MAG: hypothetical protein WAN82_02265 [Candidatus Bathyarchaeia archaeon]